MRECPYIGKLNDVFGKDAVVLFTDNSFGCVLRDKDFAWEDAKLYQYCSDWIENCFTNITKEYLENKCVKIESPEHSEFVQKLAFKAGYAWTFDGKLVTNTEENYLYFYDDGEICYNDTRERGWELIQLPMPPKDNLQEDEDVDEWQPIIGEKALAPSDGNGSVTTVTVAYFGDDNYVLVFDSRKKPMWVCKSLLKPLSKEDILLEEVTTFLEDAEGLGSKVTALGLIEKFKIEMKEE